MNILYIAFVDIKQNSFIGVKKKIDGQVKALTKLGNNLSYIVYENSELVMYDKNSKRTTLSMFKNKIDQKLNLYKEINKIIEEQNIHAIYMRYPVAWFGLLRLLKKIKSPQLKIYLEIPTYPYYEELSTVLKIKDKITTIMLKKYINKIVISSDKIDSLFGIECIFIDNCVDVEKIKQKKIAKNEEIIRMIGVSYIRNTVGYDRIINGVGKYLQNNTDKQIQLLLVGDGDKEEIEKLEELISKYNLQKNVKLVGSKTGQELDELFDISDIAIGSLGDHRLGVYSKSPLKSREYCARSIPFISSIKDPGFLGNEEFILNVSADDTEIDMQELIYFYEKVNKNKELPDMMREYAKQHFDWSMEYKKIF